MDQTPLQTIPHEHYRCPEFLQRELRDVFAKGWTAVAHQSQVLASGDRCSLSELGATLVVERSDAGDITVSRSSSDSWSESQAVPLDRVRSAVWGGLVWVNLDGQAPPLLEYLGPIASELEPYKLEEMVPLEQCSWELPCNWKAILDNTNETYHVAAVHPHTIAPLKPSLALTPFGRHCRLEATTRASSAQAPFRKFLLFPNVLLNVLPHHLTVVRAVPITTGTCRVHYGFYRPRSADALGRLRARASWLISRRVWKEDTRVLAMFQRGVESGGSSPGLVHRELEVALGYFHRQLRNAMQDGSRTAPVAATPGQAMPRHSQP